MKFLTVVFFVVGMTGALAWDQASVAQKAAGMKTAFGLVAIVSLIVAVALGSAFP